MRAPTDKDIAEEIKRLEKIQPKLPRGTLANNHDCVDAQIRALKDRMSEDDIWKFWPDAQLEDEADNTEVRCCALDALRWRMGENKEKPSESWKELL